MLTILSISVFLILISFLLLGFNIFFRKKRFPETSVGHNRDMKALGIKCARCEEYRNYNEQKKRNGINFKELKVAVD